MTKYTSFRELTDSWKNRTDSALIYTAGDDKVILTFHNLYTQIHSAQSVCEVIRADHSPQTIVRIFADVIGGNDVLLIDESTPENVETQIREAFLPLLPIRKQAGNDTGDDRNEEGHILFFTSGTTDSSKTVVLSTRALLASTWGGQSMLACSKRDILLSVLPLYHVFGFVCGLLWGLCYGARVALGRGPLHVIDDCRYFHPTILPVVPTIAEELLRLDALNRELRIILIGAAVPTQETLRALQIRGIQTYTGYGLTETASGLAITRDLSAPLSLYICPGADLKIASDGEITVKTDALMEGYLDPADGSLNLPLQDGRFHTGDLGRIDERGALRITGRKKDMLMLPDGNKVFCPEYEAYLSEELGSDELCVILDNGRPALLYSSRLARPLVEKAVTTLNRHYPRSRQIAKLIPREGLLPRTATGKIMRWVLQK